jgi:hypothetical protein
MKTYGTEAGRGAPEKDRRSLTLNPCDQPEGAPRSIPVAIQRLMDEVRLDQANGGARCYDRAHLRHNRS